MLKRGTSGADVRTALYEMLKQDEVKMKRGQVAAGCSRVKTKGGVERVKSEDFMDWVHRRLAEGDSNSDLRPSKPSDPLAPSDPSDSSNSSPAVYTISPTTNFVLRCSQNGPSEPFLSTTQAARL